MLRLRDPTRIPDPLAEWPLPIEVPFIESRELSWLREDLHRYAHGRVSGRSYLIAGNRGAGKTALVQHAADQLAAAIMREAVKENGRLEPGPFQRPLLVKLHGPSMLELPEGPTATQAGPAEGGTIQPGSHAALVQITVGLYRALAAEAAIGFRAHAQLAGSGRRGDHAELATQLALDLDAGLPPSRLRFYWAKLGRLANGVLWPRTADDSLEAHGVGDQGMREIMALATAAQTFQVCTGRLSYSETSKDQIVRKEVAEAKGSSDLKDALLRLGTLGLGALTGVSILGIAGGSGDGAVASSVVGGLAVWLLGSLSVTWSFNRTRTDDRSVDYSFIRDFSLATLGRDLPVVINRVRAAGLAPVFVVDELDKVTEAPTALSGLIGQLKHLVADFGFFCFLVNRDCYDAIEAKVRTSAYPPEHTLFGDRLLLRPDPTSMLRHVASIVDADQAEPQSALARVVFGLNAIHQARLNLTELTRELAHAPLAGDALPGPRDLGDVTTLLTQRRLVVATVQVAIEQALRSPKLSVRMDSSPSFAQLAIDALYYPSRQWGDGVRDIDPSHEALRAHLGKRRGMPVPKGDGAVRPGEATGIDDEDLDLLQEHLVVLLGWLADLEALRSALGGRNALGAPGTPLPGDVQLADVVPRDIDAVCVNLGDGHSRFLFSRSGDPIVVDPGRLNDAQRRQAIEGLEFAQAISALIERMGTRLDELARTPLLASVNEEALEGAMASIGIALRRNDHNPEVQQHLSTLLRLRAEVSGQAGKLAALLLIVASLSRDAATTSPILPAIARLIPFESDPAHWIRGLEGVPAQRLPSEASELRQWTATCMRWLLPSPGSRGLEAPPDYGYLGTKLREFFDSSRRELTPDYPMLLQAVRHEPPATALASDLGTLTAGDWSRLALSAVPTRDKAAAMPYWLFIAGLRGLGFGREALSELTASDIAQELSETEFQWLLETHELTREGNFDLARDLAASASPGRPPGILVVEHEGERFSGDPPSPRRPVLIVDARDHDGYLPTLNWLLANDILTGRTIGMDDAQRDAR